MSIQYTHEDLSKKCFFYYEYDIYTDLEKQTKIMIIFS